MGNKIYRDSLGEVENLSIFERYPQFAKRLMIATGILLFGGGGLIWFLTQEKPVDCGQEPAKLISEDCQGDLYCVREFRGPTCLEIWVEKTSKLPLTVSLWADKKNLRGIDGNFPVRLDDNQARRTYSFSFADQKNDNEQKIDFLLRYAAIVGTSPTDHKPEAPYEIPLPSRVGYQVITPNNPMTKENLLGFDNAVSFSVSSGTPVFAMREGTVVAVRDDQNSGGRRTESLGKDNFILIQHFDGTVATYKHLSKNSAVVKPGEKVVPSQRIAASGSSGFTEQSLLTVSVSAPGNTPSGIESLPIEFITRDGVKKPGRFEIIQAPANRDRKD